MKYFRLFVFVMVCLMPNISSASLVINEIAWQGYLGDANNEWIELFNEGTETINLDGWLLESSDGTPSINLSGILVNPSEFILLERTDDSTVPEEIAAKFYSGAISNEGENFILKNSNGTVVDTVNFSSGWGDMQSSSTGTMSRFGSSWREGEATPKSQNISLETEGEDDQENDSENGDSEEEDSENETETSSKTGSSSSEEKETKKTAPKGAIEALKQSFVGVPIFFESSLFDDDGDELRKGIYVWNMGDGTVLYKSRKEDFSYVYQHEGEYVVTLSFNKFSFGEDLSELEPYIFDEHIIVVSKHDLELEYFSSDGTVVFKNNASQTLDMSHWNIESGGYSFIIPKHTRVRSGKTITFPGNVTGIRYGSLTLKDARGENVSYTNKQTSIQTFSQNTTQSSSEGSSEKSFEDIATSVDENREHLTSLVSYSEQKTMYVGLFVLLAVLISIIVWLLFSSKKETQEELSGYEIVEE